MDTSIITAHSFHSGGTTSGIQNSVQSDQLMKSERWKSVDVFFNNYVAVHPRQDTTDQMLEMYIVTNNQDEKKNITVSYSPNILNEDTANILKNS
jgi:hypothetical protein